MTLHKIKELIEFECDWCGEILTTWTDDFPNAIKILRDEGWTALPPLETTSKDWRHRCDKCRFPKEAA